MIGDYCRSGRAPTSRDYTVLGGNVLVGPDATLRARGRPRQRVPGARACGCGDASSGRLSDLRQGVRCEEGVVLGDECFVGEQAVINPGVKVYPSKTVEAGATVNSSIVWESRGTRSLFGRVGVTGLANVDISPELAVRLAMAYATTLKRGATRHDLARHQPSRPGAQARHHGRPQRGRRERRRPGGRHGAGHPLPGPHEGRARAGSASAGPGRPAGGPDPVLRRRRRRHRRDDPAQDRAARATARTSAGCRPPRSATSGFPPRALEHYTAALMDGIDLDGRASRPVQAGARLRLRHGEFRDAQRARQARRRRAGGQPVRLDRRGRWRSTGTRTPARWPSWCRASGAHLGAVIDPDGERLTIVDDAGHVLSDDEALLLLLRLVVTTQRPTPGGAAGGGQPGRRGASAPRGAPDRLDQDCPRPT